MSASKKRTSKKKPPAPTTHQKRNYTRHRTDVKAAVLAALLAGQMPFEISQDFHVARSTIVTWQSELTPEQIERIRQKRGEELEDKIRTYLNANLDALIAQAKVASDPAYLRRQDADKLAVLHGVMTDKTVRILEASQQQSLPGGAGASGDDEEDEPTTKQIGAGSKVIDVEATSKG